MTHAEKEWTDFKVDGHSIRTYFDEIIICDVNKPKGSDEWLTAIKTFDARPDETVIFGDSINGDIIAAHTIGVKKLIWVNVTAGWQVYKSGDLPEGVVEVKTLHEVHVEEIFSS